MKLIKKILFTFFLVLIVTTTVGQSFDNSGEIGNGARFSIENKDGHPFLMNDWYEGNLVKNDGTMTDKVFLNYQIVDNFLTVMRIRNGKKTFLKINNDDYKGFILKDNSNKVFLYKKILGGKFKDTKRKSKFYLISNPPKNTIIIETTKKFQDPNANGWSSTTNTTKRGKYKSQINTYILNKDSQFIKVKLSNSGITRALKPYKKKIKAFIKSRGIRIKSAIDLIPVMNYYSTLN